MRDSYMKFFSEGYISKEQFFEFGLKETIYVDFNKTITNPSFKAKMSQILNELSADSSFESKDIEKLKAAINNEFMPIEIKA